MPTEPNTQTTQPTPATTTTSISPTRTMQSDAARAASIEAEREEASARAIAEIKALEEALRETAAKLDQTKPNNSPTSATKDTTKDQTAAAKEGQEVDDPFDLPLRGNARKSAAPRSLAAEIAIEAENVTVTTKDKPSTPATQPTANDVNTTPDLDDNDGKGNTADTAQPKTTEPEDSLITVIDDETPEPAPGEDIRITTLKKEISRLEKSKLEYTQKRSQFTKQEEPIRQKIKQISARLEAAKGSLQPFIEQEKKINAQILQIEEAEKKAADPHEKHRAENARWQLEDRRHQIEQKKWETSRQVEQIALDLQTAEDELRKVLDEAKSTDEAIAAATQKIRELDLEIRLVELGDKKEKLEAKWVELNDKKRDTENQLELTRNDENSIEAQVRQLLQNPINTNDLAVQREFEQERHRLSMERRDLEKKRWQLEQDLSKFSQEIEQLKPQYQNALDNESRLQQELDQMRATPVHV